MEILSVYGMRQNWRRRGEIRFSSVNALDERYNVVRLGLPNGVSVGTSFRVIWSWSKSVN